MRKGCTGEGFDHLLFYNPILAKLVLKLNTRLIIKKIIMKNLNAKMINKHVKKCNK